MKLCHRCQASNQLEAAFCANCGFSLQKQIIRPLNKAPKPKQFNWILVGAIGAVLLVGFGLFVTVLSRMIAPNRNVSEPVIITSSAQYTPTPAPARAAPVAPAQSAADHLGEYRKMMRTIDPQGDIVVNVIEGRQNDTINVTVANSFHYEPYQMRLQLAQTFWQGWSRIHSPTEPDKARIKVLDMSGNEVGGSRVWGGSVIWVKE